MQIASHFPNHCNINTMVDSRTYSQLFFRTNAPRAKYASAEYYTLKLNVLVSGSVQVNGARGARSERTYFNVLVNNQANTTKCHYVPPNESCKSLSPTRAGAPGGSVRGRDTITGSTCSIAE
jgi:hypothetical protein